MVNTVVIRHASLEDTDPVARLDAAAANYEGLGKDKLSRFIASQGVLIAEIDGNIVGYVATRIHPTRSIAVLDGIVVLVEFSGRGIGRALLDAAQRTPLVRRCDFMDLEVQADRPGLIKFYRADGFRRHWQMKRKVAYYSNGAAAIRMRKRLRSRLSGIINLLTKRKV